jgi:hypothetical protein
MISEILFVAIFSTAAVQETDNLKRNMVALELFLRDQEDHKNYCPEIKWQQPNIEVYKKVLASQLPEGCKK